MSELNFDKGQLIMNAAIRCIALAAGGVVALHACPAAGADTAKFVFTPLAPPGNAGYVFLTGVHQDKAVGDYIAADGSYRSFLWSAGHYSAVPGLDIVNAISDSGLVAGNTPGSTTSYSTYDVTSGVAATIDFGPLGGSGFAIGGINSGGTVVATQFTTITTKKGQSKTFCQPFEQDAHGTYTWLGESATNGFNPVGLTDDGVVVLTRECNKYRLPYFVNRGGKQVEFRIPGSEGPPGVQFVSGAGFGGNYYTPPVGGVEQSLGFTTAGNSSKLTIYPVPPKNSVGIDVTAFGPHHQVAGYSWNSFGQISGFIYANKTYRYINYPGKDYTIITGLSSTGAIVGYYGDTPEEIEQPFIATCASDAGCAN